MKTGEGVNGVARLRPVMGTLVVIEASHAHSVRAAAAVDAAFQTIAELERTLHPERAGSDLVAIRGALVGTAVQVAPTTVQLLQLAKDIWQSTDGIFDPCLPDALGAMGDLIVHDEYVIAVQPVHLDLGGIAKGFAVDMAIETLIAHDCVAGVVNAGGDMRAFGAEREVVVVCGELQLRRSLDNAAIAVSDARAVSAPPEHRGYYRRHNPSRLCASGALVYASRAAVADAFTKCLLLSHPHAYEAALRAFGARGETW